MVAAAVILPASVFTTDFQEANPWLAQINDSKKVPPLQRTKLAQLIQTHCQVSIAECSVEEIDRYNILHASLYCMRKALAGWGSPTRVALVDGNQDPYKVQFTKTVNDVQTNQQNFKQVLTVIGGDSKSIAIAAASIVAKVYRDNLMVAFDQQYPGYNLAEHKGYPTPAHKQLIKKIGISAIHRTSFAPVKELLV